MYIVYIETIKDAVFAFVAIAEASVAKMNLSPFVISDWSENRKGHQCPFPHLQKACLPSQRAETEVRRAIHAHLKGG